MLPINPNGRIIIIIISCSWLFLHWYYLILESYCIFVAGLFQPRFPTWWAPGFLLVSFPQRASWFPSSSYLSFPACISASVCLLLVLQSLPHVLNLLFSKVSLLVNSTTEQDPTFLFPLPITVSFPSHFHIVWDLWSLATHPSLLSLQPLPCISYKGCRQLTLHHPHLIVLRNDCLRRMSLLISCHSASHGNFP